MRNYELRITNGSYQISKENLIVNNKNQPSPSGQGKDAEHPQLKQWVEKREKKSTPPKRMRLISS